jgi:hypothetical protein
MPSALVKDVLYRAGVLLNDAAPAQYTSFPEIDLVQTLNDAQVAVCKIAPWASSRVDSIKLTANKSRQHISSIASANMIPMDGSASVTVRGMFLTSLICNMGSDGLTEGSAIRLVSLDTATAANPDWPTQSSDMVEEYVFDARYPQVFLTLPKPNAAIWVLAAYQSLPVAIPAGGNPGAEVYAFGGSSTQTITIDDRYVDDLVHYVVGRTLLEQVEQAADQPRGEFFFGLFGSSLKAHADMMRAMDPSLARS